MKKLNLFLLFFSMVFFTTVQAQFGVKLGANFSATGDYANSEEGESASLKPGFQLGVFYNKSVSDKLDIMVELNYEGRGTISKKDYSVKLPVQDPASGAVLGIGDYHIVQEANSAQNYINIPILAVFGGEKIKFYVGPNIGFMLSGKADFDRTIDIALGGNQVGSVKTNLKDVDWKSYDSFKQIFTRPPADEGAFLNSLEFGINLGLMYNISEKLFFDLRVNQGLSDTTNNAYDSSIYPSSDFTFAKRSDTDRNLSIQIGIGYKF